MEFNAIGTELAVKQHKKRTVVESLKVLATAFFPNDKNRL